MSIREVPKESIGKNGKAVWKIGDREAVPIPKELGQVQKVYAGNSVMVITFDVPQPEWNIPDELLAIARKIREDVGNSE